jgi:glycosyltransferase A (GT-A) superfamily protein (DUF2064 family)
VVGFLPQTMIKALRIIEYELQVLTRTRSPYALHTAIIEAVCNHTASKMTRHTMSDVLSMADHGEAKSGHLQRSYTCRF